MYGIRNKIYFFSGVGLVVSTISAVEAPIPAPALAASACAEACCHAVFASLSLLYALDISNKELAISKIEVKFFPKSDLVSFLGHVGSRTPFNIHSFSIISGFSESKTTVQGRLTGLNIQKNHRLWFLQTIGNNPFRALGKHFRANRAIVEF